MSPELDMELVQQLEPHFRHREVIGAWHYVTPIAPATVPEHMLPHDSLDPVPTFDGSITNAPGHQPASFRLWPKTTVQLRSGPLLGISSYPTRIFVLPVNYRPLQGPVSLVFGSYDGTALYSGRVDTNGDVWVLGAAGTSATSLGSVQFSGAPVTIANGAGPTGLTWDDPAGDTIVDLTDPAFPLVLADGVYAVSGVIQAVDSLTVGGYYSYFFSMGVFAIPFGPSPFSTVAIDQVTVPFASTYKLSAGDGIQIAVTNHDGVNAIDFALYAGIARTA